MDGSQVFNDSQQADERGETRFHKQTKGFHGVKMKREEVFVVDRQVRGRRGIGFKDEVSRGSCEEQRKSLDEF